MTKQIAALTTVFLVALGLAAYTGTAVAGNDNGKAAATQSGGPGNSENAPGQVKKDDAATAGSQGDGSVDQNSASTTGVKPTSGTAKDTNCSTTSGGCVAPASEGPTANAMGNGDASKRYGNDQTAAQIATASGAPLNTNLHGPGNSQPHKVALCPGGHEVDVHALKAKGLSASCGSTAVTPPTTNVTPPTTTLTTAVVPATTTVGAVVGTTPAGATPAATTPAVTGVTPSGVPTGGVAGVTATQGTPAGGVLGAIEAVGQGTLPFTGFPLWIVALAALGFIVSGLALRRRAGATV